AGLWHKLFLLFSQRHYLPSDRLKLVTQASEWKRCNCIWVLPRGNIRRNLQGNSPVPTYIRRLLVKSVPYPSCPIRRIACCRRVLPDLAIPLSEGFRGSVSGYGRNISWD